MRITSGEIRSRLLLILSSLTLMGCASFELTSTPEAEIYENGLRIGTTPYSFSLVSGFRSFTLRRYGYVEKEITVTALDSRRQHHVLHWIARTEVDSLPQGAKVVRLEDRKVLGVTPCRLYLSRPVAAVFRLEGFEEMKCDIVPNRKQVVQLDAIHAGRPVRYREIYFTSRQGAVEIHDRIAGERIGVTPVRLTLEAGSQLEYRLRDHLPEQVVISRNAPFHLDIRLKPIKRVTLDGPAGARVYRAGENSSLGEVPLTITVEGAQLYEIKKTGYHDRTVALSEASLPKIEVELDRIPYKTILTDPPGASVYRLGGVEKLGTAPLTLAVSAECVFEIRKEGYQNYAVGLGPASADQVRVELVPVLVEDKPPAASIRTLDHSVLRRF